jgi:hypothetical protein
MRSALTTPIAGSAVPIVVEGTAADVLEDIVDPAVSLAIWNRRRPRALADWLDGLPAERLPEGRFVCSIEEARPRLASLCDLVGLDDPRRNLLIDDIARLAGRFAALAGARQIDIRLEAVDHDSCWKFHRDHVGLRLNLTYRGPGTQWPPLAEAGRAARAQRRYTGPLNEVAAFAIALFKGTRLVGKRAVLHRSPPIAGSGATRLFLCINEAPAD